jgi:hypothetical protein
MTEPESRPPAAAFLSAGASGEQTRRKPLGDQLRKPLVSLVVPVYNGAQHLQECLDSILGQTYPNVEILVLDDASQDATPAVVGQYGERVTYFRQDRNVGQFSNVATGIDLARGQFVGVFHADDRYRPEIVERQVDYFLRHPEVAAVFTLDRLIDADGREYGRVHLPPEVPGNRPISFPTVFNGMLEHQNRFLRTPGTLVRKSVYAEVGLFDAERFGMAADMEMWLRISRRYPIVILTDHLFDYRHFHGSVSQDYERVRVTPHISFEIMDLYLEMSPSEHVHQRSLDAYEAHRMEDFIMCAITCYIIGDLAGARARLKAVRAHRIIRSSTVQRLRLLILLVGLTVLCRIPRIPGVVRLFQNRWHAPKAPTEN